MLATWISTSKGRNQEVKYVGLTVAMHTIWIFRVKNVQSSWKIISLDYTMWMSLTRSGNVVQLMCIFELGSLRWIMHHYKEITSSLVGKSIL